MGLRCGVGSTRWDLCLRVALTTVFLSVGCPQLVAPSWGYTPESPLVRSLREQGIAELKDVDHEELGGKSQIALVHLNEYGRKDHPQVQRAAQACRAELSGKVPNELRDSIYSTTISCIFLCELDAEKYRPEIDFLLASLEHRQRPYGAWGYPPHGQHPKTGDTSMTQYGVLCLWTAHEKGVEISTASATKAGNWLLRTQDPSGAWGYQGNDPGVGGGPRSRQQREIRHSMVAAGLGSLYVLADLFHMGSGRRRSIDSATPSVLRKAPTDTREPTTKNMDQGALRSAVDLGDRWFDQNFQYRDTEYTYYYMYAYERYRAFRENYTGQPEEEPDWYNVGVEFLREQQKDNGTWHRGVSPDVDTAFALLFLQRSTRKHLRDDRFDGTLIQDNVLPTGRWTIGEDGRIKEEQKLGLADEFISRLEDEVDLESPESLPDIKLSDDPESRETQIARLERLVRAAKFEQRYVAVKTLAGTRELERVPALIFGLSDPDSEIVRQSRDGLRFISRRFIGFGLPDEPEETDVQSAITNWKGWYLSVNPEAEFWK